MIGTLLLSRLPILATSATTHASGTVEHADSAASHGGGQPHIPNILTFISETFAHHYEVTFFAFLMAVILIIGAMVVYKKRQMIPGPFQNFVEMLIEGLYGLVHAILGKETDRYLPFLGTLFLYIWFMNLMGMVPFLHGPTSSINMTAALGVSVFLYVQFTALTRSGPKRYLLHLMGDPRSGVEWGLVIINFPLHLIGEVIKPFSLSMRLFGNIMGEDTLIASMVGLGVLALSVLKSPIGIPFQIPFYFLGLLTSTIQALVFTLLSTAYFYMVLPHEEHH